MDRHLGVFDEVDRWLRVLDEMKGLLVELVKERGTRESFHWPSTTASTVNCIDHHYFHYVRSVGLH